jgi:hypothetical protein
MWISFAENSAVGIQPFKQNGKLIDFVVANARKSPIGFKLHQDFAGVQRSEAHKHVQCKPSEWTSGSKEAAVIPTVHQHEDIKGQELAALLPVSSSRWSVWLRTRRRIYCRVCRQFYEVHQTHRIHGAGIYANIKGVYWWDPWSTIYSSTMDPSWERNLMRRVSSLRWRSCKSRSQRPGPKR